MAQDLWTLQEKGKSQPAHGPPLQARVVAANRTVLANFCDDPGAHGNEQGVGISKRTGQKKMRAAGMDGKGEQANTACRRSDRHRP